MTLYPASSPMAVIVPTEAFGGCGNLHSRPVRNGAPVHPWTFDCPACENHLRHDPLWSSTLSEIPETHDENKAREDFDKRGARDKDQVLALALAKLAGIELPESLLRPITGNLPKTIALMECPAGHPGKPGSKFCATCGVAMHQPVNALTAARVLCPEGHENTAAAKFCAECGIPMAALLKAPQAQAAHLATGEPEPAANGRKVRLRDMRLEDLQAKARDAGLDDAGTRVELIDRLKAQPAEVAA